MRRAGQFALGCVLVLSVAGIARADSGPTDYGLLDGARKGHYIVPGQQGATITALQNALAGVCHPVTLTGKYDVATAAAVRQFQSDRGCSVDAIIGPETMKAFDTALGIGKTASPGLVRIQQSQVTPAITAGAVAILNAHRTDDIGTEIPFTADGNDYVGRIELHFHPFGGTMHPWGYHHGVSVYAVTQAPPPPPPAQNGVTGIPARAANALTGSQFMAQTAGLTGAARMNAVFQQIASGNIPDYMAIGSNDDFVRIPMDAPTAQKVADLFSASLPTRKMVNQIWTAATIKIAPSPLPAGPQMTTNSYFLQEQQKIEAELVGKPRGELVAGDKKDLVITNLLAAHPDRVAIYGWHQLNGQPIQPLTVVHAAGYYDYSHGIRLVSLDVTYDGNAMQLDDILKDPGLAGIVSDEGPIANPRIP